MVSLTFREDDHTYWLGAARLPSVTQLLGPIQGHLAGVPAAILEAARNKGRRVHLACEMYDHGRLESCDPIDRPYVDAWIRFKNETGYETWIVEEMMHDGAMRYAGKPDTAGIMKEWLWQIDRKTGTYHHSYAIQTAGYQHLLRQRLPVERRGCVVLYPDASYQLHEHTEAGDWPVFVSLLTLHNYRERHAP